MWMLENEVRKFNWKFFFAKECKLVKILVQIKILMALRHYSQLRHMGY